MTEVSLVFGFIVVLDSVAINTHSTRHKGQAYLTVSVSVWVVVVVSHDSGKA
jgi:hypothetical protein